MQTLKGINIVIASDSERLQRYLCEQLVAHGAEVAYCGFLNDKLVDQIECNSYINSALLIINDTEGDDRALNRLLEQSNISVLFYEHSFDATFDLSRECGFSKYELHKLVLKLQELTQHSKEKGLVDKNKNKKIDEVILLPPVVIKEKQLTLNKTEVSKSMIFSEMPVQSIKKRPNTVTTVWVLGASLGGPDATKRFLSNIPSGLPIAFVLAQHLGHGFIPLFASQLNAVSHLTVKEGLHEDILHHGEVVLVPVNKRMLIDMNGKIKLIDEPWQGHYNPSINEVIDTVSNVFKQQSGVIIFSGMGSDGCSACQAFFEKYDGVIWAQDTDSCVISSMPDSVRQANICSFSGTPEALASKIIEKYRQSEQVK